jgi:regulator of protease activity HflC (stomatin/prohibitin superfamily)
MDNNEVLDHLLKIEAEAAALVNEAQAEADKRITEAEKQNRAAYDKRFVEENQRLEKGFLQSKELAREQFRKELETYKEKISSVHVDNDRFSSLLDSLVLGEG